MFNKIIESNKYVIENAKYIQINKEEIKKFANGIQEVNIKKTNSKRLITSILQVCEFII